MKLKKNVALILSGAMVMTTLSSCAMLDKSKTEIEETITSYIDAVAEGKEKDLKKIIDADEITLINLETDEQRAILEAILESAEIKVTDVEASKKDEEAEATLTIEYVDAEKLFEDGDYKDVEEFIEALEDGTTTKEKIDFELVYDDEQWLISEDTHNEIVKFLESTVNDISFSALTEAAGENLINAFMAELSAGNVQEALDMINYEKTAIQLYGLDNEGAGDYEANYNSIYGTFFSNSSIDDIACTVNEETNSMDIVVTGSVPSNESIANQFVEDDAAIANFEAGIMAMLLGHSDYLSWIDDYLSTMEGYIPTSETRPFTSTFVVTADDEGNLSMTGDIEDMLPDWNAMSTYISENNITLSDERKEAINNLALQQLLRDGIITQEQYEQVSNGGTISGSIGGSTTVEPDEPTEGAPSSAYNVVRSGDCFRVNFLDENGNEVTEYTSDSKEIVIEVQTFSYYDAGTEVSYDVSIAGKGTNTYTAEFLGQTGEKVDKITIEIDPVEIGYYTVTVHEVDSSVVMATIEVYVNK